MKQILLVYLFPFVLAIFSIYYISNNAGDINLFFAKKTVENTSTPAFNYIGNFENTIYEDAFLKSGDSTETIFLLGSSELVYSSPAIPYNFISDHFKTKLKAVGHAGNQCFSIYVQLLANYQRLKNAPVVIIISPGWLESKASKGTTSKIFLEFNSESFLRNINSNSADEEFVSYADKRISQLYSEFNSPNLQLKLMNFNYRSSVSLLHKLIFYPLICSDKFLSNQKEKIEPTKQIGTSFKRLPIMPQSVSINWDSLFSSSKKEVLSKATNNNLGVNNEYYTQHVHGKTGNMQPVPTCVNQETEDFKMLIKLVKEKNMNVRFIISPLNPLYYKNLKDLSPTVSIIENEIKSNNMAYFKYI